MFAWEEIKNIYSGQDRIDLSLSVDLECESYTWNLSQAIMLNFKKTNEAYHEDYNYKKFDKKIKINDKETNTEETNELEEIIELEEKIRWNI